MPGVRCRHPGWQIYSEYYYGGRWQTSMSKKSRKNKIPDKRSLDATGGKAAPFEPAVHRRWQIAAICVALALVTVITFWNVRHNDFLMLDDDEYVALNQNVQHGINLQSVEWAFTTFNQSNWHPLTWVSHMADWSFYGNHPAGHHLTNLCIHSANAVLLFLLLLYMTNYLWRSAIVAFLFALHPAHVESVAWIAERKDVLCAFFLLATLLAYAWYVRRPSWKRFAAVAFGFACALMSKPMAVTLPFSLLLLDYWPLRRVSFNQETRASGSPLSGSYALKSGCYLRWRLSQASSHLLRSGPAVR